MAVWLLNGMNMRRMIFSLLLLSGVVAKAQSNWPTVRCGDTTYYLLDKDDVGFLDSYVFTEGMYPMGFHFCRWVRNINCILTLNDH